MSLYYIPPELPTPQTFTLHIFRGCWMYRLCRMCRGLGAPRAQVRGMATQLKDYHSLYDVLGIPAECTKTEIREAWLKLSMLHHPDLNKDNPEEAQEKFMEIKEAYTTLINDEKRKAYNDKIGFYHSDPPPDFKREWTFKGEMERSGAASYHVMWSEEAIRKLMSSDKLRDVSTDHYLNGHIAIMFLISSDELA